MIRHIVCWKFLDHAEGASKAENLREAKSRIEGLTLKIPEILSLEVGIDSNQGSVSFDLIDAVGGRYSFVPVWRTDACATPTSCPFTLTVKAADRISCGTGADCTRAAACAATGSARTATINQRNPSKKTLQQTKWGRHQCSTGGGFSAQFAQSGFGDNRRFILTSTAFFSAKRNVATRPTGTT